MLEHIVSRAVTELNFLNISSYPKDVTTENKRTFEHGRKSGINIPIYIIVGYMQRDQFNQQQQNIDTFRYQLL